MEEGKKKQIREALGGQQYRKLFSSARKRLEQGDTVRSITVTELSRDEQEGIANLLALPTLPETTVRIPLDRLEGALLGSRLQAGLREVLEALGGPLGNRREERLQEEREEKAFWEAARKNPAAANIPCFEEWLGDLKSYGLLSRVGKREAKDLLGAAVAILSRLPEKDIDRSVLAAEVTKDSHALDTGERLNGIVVRALVRMVGLSEIPRSAAEERSLWEEVGVVCDSLSSDVLVLGMRSLGTHYLDDYLKASAEHGEPAKLTLRQLSDFHPTVSAGTVVYVCENPAVVANVADKLGLKSPPIVCTNGVSSTAVMRLLEDLFKGGARILFHGDFDWGGIRIMNRVHARVQGVPWRFGAEDYEKAIAKNLGHSELAPRPVQANWDRNLHLAMEKGKKKVYEEQLVGDLLADLL